MKMTVLSHAGLLVENDSGQQLICDPWLVGSCYWRSWWNYPPVDKPTLDRLKPDVIYLTHIHWDHFHGPSLELFDSQTRILVPKGNYARMKKDLATLGFRNVLELRHGETYTIAPGFQLTSYQFGIFLDSAPLIECDGMKILNLNDSKHMGLTLAQIVRKHRPIDFVLRSHSSANSRMSYEFIDKPDQIDDDIERYSSEFADTAVAVGARYAVPFASNHCHLHRDSWKYNDLVQTPAVVAETFRARGIATPALKVMVSGDSYDSRTDTFTLRGDDWFTARSRHLDEYQAANAEKLADFYAEEERTSVSPAVVEKYFRGLASRLPWLAKWALRKATFTYVLWNGDHVGHIVTVNAATGDVHFLPPETPLDFERFPIQIHTTTFIFKRCIAFRIFSHMAIGKRVFYKLHSRNRRPLEALNLMFNLDEYDMLPLRRLFTPRSLETWALRWREIVLYMQLVRDKVLRGRLDFSRYIQPIR
jgi:UDP-MurNAc hydroxylase